MRKLPLLILAIIFALGVSGAKADVPGWQNGMGVFSFSDDFNDLNINDWTVFYEGYGLWQAIDEDAGGTPLPIGAVLNYDGLDSGNPSQAHSLIYHELGGGNPGEYANQYGLTIDVWTIDWEYGWLLGAPTDGFDTGLFLLDPNLDGIGYHTTMNGNRVIVRVEGGVGMAAYGIGGGPALNGILDDGASMQRVRVIFDPATGLFTSEYWNGSVWENPWTVDIYNTPETSGWADPNVQYTNVAVRNWIPNNSDLSVWDNVNVTGWSNGGTVVDGKILVVETDDSTDVDEEGATSDSYEISLLAEPNNAVVIGLSWDANQIDVDTTQLSFAPADYNVPQMVTVTAVDDAVPEGSQSVPVTHSVASSDPNYAAIADFDVTVNITDNDLKEVLIVESAGSTDVDEGEPNTGPTSDDYTVALAAPPTGGDVQITMNFDSVQVDVVPTVLIFTSSDWKNPQPVTVTAVDDDLSEGPHTSTITHSASGGGYDGVSADLVVNITDNEQYCGQSGTVYRETDLNEDCYVDLFDFAIMAEDWLKCTDPFKPLECDVTLP